MKTFISLKNCICSRTVEQRYNISMRRLEEFRRLTRETGVLHGPKFYQDNKMVRYNPKDIEEHLEKGSVHNNEAAKKYQEKYKNIYQIKLKRTTTSTTNHEIGSKNIENKKKVNN